MLSDKQRDERLIELIDWFIERNINPMDGGLMMVRLLAIQFVRHSTDPENLKKAIDMTTKLMVYEISELLKEEDEADEEKVTLN
jgi:hypothetical protein